MVKQAVYSPNLDRWIGMWVTIGLVLKSLLLLMHNMMPDTFDTRPMMKRY